METQLKFTENQYFGKKILYFIYPFFLVLISFFAYGLYKQIFLMQSFGNLAASNYPVLIVCLFVVILFFIALLFFVYSHFETLINEQGVAYRWVPFNRTLKIIPWENISRAEIITYGFVGRGMRASKGLKIYSFKGDQGLELLLKNGNRIVIGTQNVRELSVYLKKVHPAR